MNYDLEVWTNGTRHVVEVRAGVVRSAPRPLSKLSGKSLNAALESLHDMGATVRPRKVA